jgi:hypothetical protein
MDSEECPSQLVRKLERKKMEYLRARKFGVEVMGMDLCK